MGACEDLLERRCADCGAGLPPQTRPGRMSPRCEPCRKARKKAQWKALNDKAYAKHGRRKRPAEERAKAAKAAAHPTKAAAHPTKAPIPAWVGPPPPGPANPECSACGRRDRLYAMGPDRVCLRCWHRWREV